MFLEPRQSSLRLGLLTYYLAIDCESYTACRLIHDTPSSTYFTVHCSVLDTALHSLHYSIYARSKSLYTYSRTSTNPTMGSLHDSRIHKWFATSPPVAWTVRQLRELLIGSLKQGPIPQHVAFVMDGNRRFARNHHIETVEGHNLGFESLARVCNLSHT